jgi:hypothetical protein
MIDVTALAHRSDHRPSQAAPYPRELFDIFADHEGRDDGGTVCFIRARSAHR